MHLDCMGNKGNKIFNNKKFMVESKPVRPRNLMDLRCGWKIDLLQMSHCDAKAKTLDQKGQEEI